MKSKGVRIKVKDGEEYGYILRRLNADSYEVCLGGGDSTVVLSPKEFVEVEDD